MKAVIDTNVLVSGLLKAHGAGRAKPDLLTVLDRVPLHPGRQRGNLGNTAGVEARRDIATVDQGSPLRIHVKFRDVSSRLKDVRSIEIASSHVDRTLEILREYGTVRCEGLVLWVGTVEGERAAVADVWVPRQRQIRSEEGVGYFVESDVLFELNRELAASRRRLIAQVHSHPGEAYHSETDDTYAIVTTDGGFSLVVPDFGQAPADPATWAVYRLMGARWMELSRDEARRVFSKGFVG